MKDIFRGYNLYHFGLVVKQVSARLLSKTATKILFFVEVDELVGCAEIVNAVKPLWYQGFACFLERNRERRRGILSFARSFPY
jgi:hypothetical protein